MRGRWEGGRTWRKESDEGQRENKRTLSKMMTGREKKRKGGILT